MNYIALPKVGGFFGFLSNLGHATHDDAHEKPQNGLAGLKHWRHDLPAGLLVSLISLPFSLGIAMASGAPPITGITSAIIAGLVLPFLGGSYVTISGPAAGLAPILLATMATLGKGDLANGYPLLLVVICMAGCIQIVLAYFKAAKYCALFPAAVVEGMLTAIGLLIIAKQLPVLIGHPYHAHEFFDIILETPSELGLMNPVVFGLGVFTLILIFVLSSLKIRALKVLPPQVIAVLVGTIVAQFLILEPRFFINIPANPLKHGLTLPNFGGLWADGSLWSAALMAVITLTLIDGVESLATITAIDKIDPFHRKSDPNRTLLAMGVSNLCSSMAGGLTIIPGGVKSTTNIMGGGRTQWANFYNACFLLLFLLVARPAINMIPLSVLGAVLIYTGYRLCRPSVWRHITHIGREQLIPFTVTVVATLWTDLLWGIIAGIVCELLMNWVFGWMALPTRSSAYRSLLEGLKQVPIHFTNPVVNRQQEPGEYHLYFGKPLVCFNALHLDNELAKIPPDATRILLHITDDVRLIDHTSCDKLFHFVDEHNRTGKAVVEIVGLELMNASSQFRTCMRLGSVNGRKSSAGSFDRGRWGYALARRVAARRSRMAGNWLASTTNLDLITLALANVDPKSQSLDQSLDRMTLLTEEEPSGGQLVGSSRDTGRWM